MQSPVHFSVAFEPQVEATVDVTLTMLTWTWTWSKLGPATNFRREVIIPCPLHSCVEKWRNNAKVKVMTLDNCPPIKNYFPFFEAMEKMKSALWKESF